MTTEIVIDLGLDRSPPPEHGPPVDLRRLWSRWRRSVRAAVCGVLVAAAAAASAPPPSPGLTLVAEREAGNEVFLVSGDYLIINSAGGVSSVHRLPAGHYLWTGQDLYPGASPDVLYSTSCPDGGDCERPERIAWDAATGERLGPVPEDPWLPGTGLDVVLHGSHQVESGRGRVVINRPRRIEVRDEAGTVRWSVASPDWLDLVVHTEADAPSLVVYDRSSVTVRDAATGAVRGRYRVTDPDKSIFSVMIVGDLLLVDTLGDADNAVHALDLGTLTVRWQHRLEWDAWLRVCGDLLCLHRYGVGGRSTTSVIDPDSGTELWSTESWVEVVADRFLLRPMESVTVVGEPIEDARLVAPRTGETLVDLSRWTALGTGVDGTVVLAAPTSAGTAVALLDPGGTAPRYLGTVTRTFSSCTPFDGGMVCDGDAGITVWAFH